MPENNFYVFSIIIAVCALLSPGIVALINNIYALKLHKLRFAEQSSRRTNDVIDGYFRTAGACLHTDMPQDYVEFGKYCDLIFLYLPASFHDDLSYINEQILGRKIDHNLASYIEMLAATCKTGQNI